MIEIEWLLDYLLTLDRLKENEIDTDNRGKEEREGGGEIERESNTKTYKS